MSRFTVKDLREGVAELNEYLEEADAPVRFKCGGEAGYQTVSEVCAVDRKSNFMRVGSGTSREAYNQAYGRYNAIVRELEREKAEAKLAEAEAKLAKLEAQAAGERPDHYKDYNECVELSPGVFAWTGEFVAIVDDEGEVCSWNRDEWEEDSESVTATVNAVALAVAKGSAAVRKNINNGGLELRNLVIEVDNSI